MAKKIQFKQLMIDVFAMNSFSYAVALVIEMGIAQMTWQEHLQIRLVALLLNSVVARPFTLWRDYLINKFQIDNDSGFIKNYWLDTLAFLSFQLPLYVGNMVLGGASPEEILKASITISMIAGLLGRPYGVYLDWLRMKSGFNNTRTGICNEPA